MLYTKRQYTSDELLNIFRRFVMFEPPGKALEILRVIFPMEELELAGCRPDDFMCGTLTIGCVTIKWDGGADDVRVGMLA